MPTELYKTPERKIRAIIKPRGGGKTRELVDMLKKDTGLCLFVATLQRHREMEMNYPMLKGRVFSNPTTIPTEFRGIVIDNIEDFLPALPKPLVAFTLTGQS